VVCLKIYIDELKKIALSAAKPGTNSPISILFIRDFSLPWIRYCWLTPSSVFHILQGDRTEAAQSLFYNEFSKK
jgi:hypothetical protein